MLIKAIYEPDKRECFINTDFIVDIFPYDDKSYIMYSIDNERGGYVISKDQFYTLCKKMKGD